MKRFSHGRPQRGEGATTTNPRIGVSACGRIGAERAHVEPVTELLRRKLAKKRRF
jgi:hypothetical protein